MCDRPSLQCQQAIDRLKSRHSHTGSVMSLADIRIVVVFVLIIAITAIFSAVFGVRGTYFILGFHTIVNACFVIMALIANGKL